MTTRDNEGGHAAAKPGGIEGRAWVRERLPERDKPTASFPAGRSRGRTVYVRELGEGQGCLAVSEDGTHRVTPKFSPPEGEGWIPLHAEQGAQPLDIAGNRHAAKQERKAKALEELALALGDLEQAT